MRLALIPPRGLYIKTYASNMHMALAHLIGADGGYANVYRQVPAGQHIIIDNGAAEGAQVSNQALVDAAGHIGATEVVIPDVIGDYALSMERGQKFLAEFPYLPQHQYMAVPQGRNINELKRAVANFADATRITTIGAPRWMVKKLGQSSRLDLCDWIHEQFPKRFEIHLLGTSAEWVKELYYAGKYKTYIRSCDTSMPYNYALSGVELRSRGDNPKISRPSNYFSRSWYHFTDDMAIQRNVETMKRWANGIQ